MSKSKQVQKVEAKSEQKAVEEAPASGLSRLYGLITKAIQVLIAVVLVGFLVNLLALKIQRQNVELDKHTRRVVTLQDKQLTRQVSVYCFTNTTPATSATTTTVLVEGSIASFHQAMEKLGRYTVQNVEGIKFCSYDRPGVGVFSSGVNDTTYLRDVELFYIEFFTNESNVIVVAHGYGANLFFNIFNSENKESPNPVWKNSVKHVIAVDPITNSSQIDELALHNTLGQFLALSGWRRAFSKVLFSQKFFALGQFMTNSLFGPPYDYLKSKSKKIQLERAVILNDQNIYEQGNNNLRRLRENDYLKPKSTTGSKTVSVDLLTTDDSIAEQTWFKTQQTKTTKIEKNPSVVFTSIFNAIKSASST